MSIRTVIVSFGGISALARELKHRNPSTVQGWWERETIPARRQPEVLAAARRLDLAVRAVDLIPDLAQAEA